MKILKTAIEKQRVSYRGTPINQLADFSAETLGRPEESGMIQSKFLKTISAQFTILY